jgi:hypothetical protein
MALQSLSPCCPKMDSCESKNPRYSTSPCSRRSRGARGAGGIAPRVGQRGRPSRARRAARWSLARPSLHWGALRDEHRARRRLPIGRCPAPSRPAGPRGLCGTAQLYVRSRTLSGSRFACVTWRLLGSCNLISLSREAAGFAAAPAAPSEVEGRPGSRLRRHLSLPSPDPARSPTTLRPLHLLLLSDFAKLLPTLDCRAHDRQCLGIRRSRNRWAFPAKSQPRLQTPKSPRAPFTATPNPPSAPPPALYLTNGRAAFSAVGGTSPLPNDTISLIGLAFCCVPIQVHRTLLNVKGSVAGVKQNLHRKALASFTQERAERGEGWLEVRTTQGSQRIGQERIGKERSGATGKLAATPGLGAHGLPAVPSHMRHTHTSCFCTCGAGYREKGPQWESEVWETAWGPPRARRPPRPLCTHARMAPRGSCSCANPCPCVRVWDAAALPAWGRTGRCRWLKWGPAYANSEMMWEL